jgi:NAD(P)-dependent dehydrogenase (short-subunit alcohol dehydrogenase family)
MSTHSGRLDGRVAVVTGGAQGIGRAIADQLAIAGADVIVGDLTIAEGEHPGIDESEGLEFTHLDVTSEESIAALMAFVAESRGRLDIVVNNAGIMFEVPVDEQTAEQWDRMMSVNLRGPFLMAKHAARLLAHSGHGSVVNIGSIEGYSANPGHTAYAASKGGLHGLTKALAVDLGPRGIRCNAIAPGWIDTELNASYINNHPERAEAVAALARLHPIGRIGDPTDIGDVAVWLASDESRFVTGQVITVDGGRLARPSLPDILQA